MHPRFLLAILVLTLSGCNRRSGLPEAGSREYADLSSAFYLGLAALQSGEDVNARKGLERATQIAPGEPAGWVNLALLQARQQEFDAAYVNLDRARAVAPDNSRIEGLLGSVESRRGKVTEAIAHYQKAVSLDGNNIRALYAWAAETERRQSQTSDGEALELLRRIRKLRPDSSPVLLDIIRLASKRNDVEQVQEAVSALAANHATWPDVAKDRLTDLRKAVDSGDLRSAAIQAQFLRNTLVRTLEYRRSLNEVKAPDSAIGEPFLKFVKLPSPSSEPAAPDTTLQFSAQPLSAAIWAGSVVMDAESAPKVLRMDGLGLRINDAAVSVPRLPGELGPHAVLGADLNYDFKTDIVVATRSGVRILRQTDGVKFVDVTSAAKLDASVVNGSYAGAWAMDADLDGDLDVILGSTGGEPIVLRNNGDSTFAVVKPFAGVRGLVSFSNADLDADGAPDAAMVDSTGRLWIFRNQRLGVYASRDVPQSVSTGNAALAAGDLNGDGVLDVAVLRQDGSIVRVYDRDYGQGLEVSEVAKVRKTSGPLLVADLDNNGALDLVAGDQVLLGSAKGFTALSTALPVPVLDATDLNGDGRIELIGLDAAKTAVQLTSKGSRNYRWQMIRTRAATVSGDQRMNPFGVGGEIEVRSGLFTQKQVIRSPLLHFGLGEHAGVEFARVVWPNGIVQAEFELKADQTVLANQRLKGSCPFLFTWDGTRMRFLKDVGPMSAPIGAHLDGKTLEPIHQTKQWFKIAGSDLLPRSGYYDVRLTNEYWETHYVDHYSLLVVDHPVNTQVWVDERVSAEPAPLKVYVTGEPQLFRTVKDDAGRDVSAIVRDLDARYLDTFGVGQYQGFTRDHWVELELPEEAPRSGSLYLLASGFIRPWDETITMARSQRKASPAQGLRIEVPDAQGRWIVAKNDVGIPAGRLKTIVLDIGSLFRVGAQRKLRIRTEMEVYWDRLSWASGGSEDLIAVRPAPMSQADLRYRGYSLMTRAGQSSPELAHYETLVRTTPQWRDLEGYYTRYGDVRELIGVSDGRLALVNSADEVRLRFAELPAPGAGRARDYVFVTDGWIKEGDYNFRLSKTVLPLPFHGMKKYDRPLAALEDDPVFRRSPEDWQRFHTRYVTAESFSRALWTGWSGAR